MSQLASETKEYYSAPNGAKRRRESVERFPWFDSCAVDRTWAKAIRKGLTREVNN